MPNAAQETAWYLPNPKMDQRGQKALYQQMAKILETKGAGRNLLTDQTQAAKWPLLERPIHSTRLASGLSLQRRGG